MMAKAASLLPVLVLLAGCSLEPDKAKGRPKDPYPECAYVRKWFRDNLDDPDSVEVVAWGRVLASEKDANAEPGDCTLVVNYRYTDKLGARGSATRGFRFREGRPLEDPPP
jgi:hypothetical protein